MILALLQPAAAYVIVEDWCLETMTWPSSGDTDVPVDLVPALAVCNNGGAYHHSLSEDDEPVVDEELVVEGVTDLVELDWELAPNTDYHLLLSPEFSEEIELRFRTGERSVERSDGTPTVSTDHHWERLRDRGSVTFDAAPAEQPEGERALFDLLHPDGELEARLVQERTGANVAFDRWFFDEPAGEVCFRVSQRQLDGSRLESELTCEVQDGCSTTGAAALGLPAAFALLGLRRRQ